MANISLNLCMYKVRIDSDTLKMINAIVVENDLNSFDLLVEGDPNKDQTVEMQFYIKLNGRYVKALVPIVGEED